MDFNRNQFFFIGMFILLIGLQVRMVDTYVLSPEATKFLADRTGNASTASTSASPGAFSNANLARKRACNHPNGLAGALFPSVPCWCYTAWQCPARVSRHRAFAAIKRANRPQRRRVLALVPRASIGLQAQ